MDELRSTGAASDGMVTIRVFGGLREHVGRAPLLVPASEVPTVASLLSRLDADQPRLAEALRSGLRDGYLNILVNGRNVRFLAAGETPLAGADAVAFLPPIGGG
ncbi:MAG: MoaD/ThiS family protein [Candidatus Bipolaricaulota bacterium]|nr:MoaD/ThiS family protein [Candidatus Bipolaricaulota bacterium]